MTKRRKATGDKATPDQRSDTTPKTKQGKNTRIKTRKDEKGRDETREGNRGQELEKTEEDNGSDALKTNGDELN